MMLTVDVQQINNYAASALKMTWQKQVTQEDVVAAFQQIYLALEEKPIYVIVDLLSNPQFPLRLTIHEALPPYRHPNLTEWLVIGSNWMARTVEGTLSKITGQHKVRWFSTEAEAMNYLETVLQKQPI